MAKRRYREEVGVQANYDLRSSLLSFRVPGFFGR
jgi:hypothetical protein